MLEISPTSVKDVDFCYGRLREEGVGNFGVRRNFWM